MGRGWMAAVFGVVACSGADGSATGDTADEPFVPDIVLTEAYDTIEAQFLWERDRLGANDLGYRYYIPENAVGVVWAFHGKNGSMASVVQTEWIVLYNQLAQRGIGHIITESLDREGGRWDLESDPTLNADWQRIVGIVEQMETNGVSVSSLPMAAVGFSGGTEMCATFADLQANEGWDFRGASIHNGLGVAANPTPWPLFFTTTEHDATGATPANMQSVAQDCNCPFYEAAEIPLDPRRFIRLEGINEERSQGMFDELVEMGMVAADGTRITSVDPEEMEPVLEDWIARSRYSASLGATQLRVVWATHRFNATHVTPEADFLYDLLQ